MSRSSAFSRCQPTSGSGRFLEAPTFSRQKLCWQVPYRGSSWAAQYRATQEAARLATTLKAVQQGQDMSQGGSKVEDVAPELAAANNFPASARAIDLSIRGLKCEDCVAAVRHALLEVKGVQAADDKAALAEGIVTVVADKEVIIRDLMEAVRRLEKGYRAVPYREKTWIWEGCKVNYAETGKKSRDDAPPVVLVHGFGGNVHHWRKLSADLMDEYRVFSLDLLGFGASEKPPHLTYNPHLWYRQVAAFCEEVVAEPCILVGNSIGSQVAMYVASERKELVRGICLLNCVGGMNQRGLYKDSRTLAVMRPLIEIFEFLLKNKSVASYVFSKFSSRDRIESLLKLKGSPYVNQDAVHSELVNIFVDPSLDSGAVDVFVGVFTGDPGPRPEAMLDKMDCPVLVAWGDSDPWTPIDGSIGTFFQRQAQERPNVQMVSLPETGHAPQDDRPELVARALLPWLAQLAP